MFPETRRVWTRATRTDRISIVAAIAVGVGIGAVAFHYMPPAPPPWRTVQWRPVVPVVSFIPPAPATLPEFEPLHRPVWLP